MPLDKNTTYHCPPSPHSTLCFLFKFNLLYKLASLVQLSKNHFIFKTFFYKKFTWFYLVLLDFTKFLLERVPGFTKCPKGAHMSAPF